NNLVFTGFFKFFILHLYLVSKSSSFKMKFFKKFINTITLIFIMSSKSFAMPDMTNAFHNVSFLNTKSETIKLNEYEDKILLVFFGYTHCPDICPSTLIDITKSLRELGDDAGEVQPIFISVDYLRDTPERLQKYMEFFDSRIIALTSSEDDLKKISKNFRTTFELVNPSTSNYLVEHSSNLYIIDKGLIVKRIIANGLPSSEITKTVKKLLN
ncbi:MAG: SCO family protein, partial [Pseudomonadota bacterium]|nr:SCO family protein [Pseudomonadota bacterium]